MKVDVEAQLRDYVRHVGSLSAPVGVDEIRHARVHTPHPWVSRAAQASCEVDSGHPEICDLCGQGLTVFDLRDQVESATPSPPKRRSLVASGVAAAIVFVVSVVVVADGGRDNLETVPASSPGVTEPSVPTAADPPRYQWSRIPHDEAVFRRAGGQAMNSVAVGGPGLVAVGAGAGLMTGDEGRVDWQVKAAVWTSVDGNTWSRVPHDEAVFGGESGQWMNSVTAGGPGLVAVGSDGRFSDLGYETASADGFYWWGDQAGAAAVWTSVDGITWARVPYDEAAFGAETDQVMNSVTVGGPGLVAVGSARSADPDEAVAAVWTSVDGLIWSRVAHDATVFGGGGQRMTSVVAAGTGLVAVGSDEPELDGGGERCCQRAAVWTSVDGITWYRVPHDEAVFGGTGGRGMSSVAAAGSGLVAVGFVQLGDDVPSGRARDAAVWTSVDGITWYRVPHDEAVFGGTGNQRMHSVTATASGLVAVGADGGFYATRSSAAVWTSVDGITWSRLSQDEALFGGAEMHSVAATDGGLVAVGDESLETRGPAERQEVIESGDSVFVWVAEPED